MSWWSYEKQADGKIHYVSTDYSAIPFLFMFFARLAPCTTLPIPNSLLEFYCGPASPAY